MASDMNQTGLNRFYIALGFIMVFLQILIAAGGFLAAAEKVNIESYGQNAIVLWIIIWTVIIYQIGDRKDICDNFCDGTDECPNTNNTTDCQETCDADSCSRTMLSARVIQLVFWVLFGGYHFITVASYHRYLTGKTYETQTFNSNVTKKSFYKFHG
eukprot:UN32021